MPETLRGLDGSRLERSCTRDAITFGTGAPGIERAEVFLTGGFELHRHDTYAVGVTTSGVQTFRYRGSRRTCLPGQLHVLHPDELHDGGPATEEGLGYRILYVAPELVSQALGGAPLPFVAEPVQRPAPGLAALLTGLTEPLGELRAAEIAATVADVLAERAGATPARPSQLDLTALGRVREYLAAHAREQIPAALLEQVAGLDRFAIARSFRRAYGTSPDRYRLLRRLALARAALERGEPIARAAADAGFADQSHLTRQFKRCYGVTPARWAQLTAAGRSPR